MESVLLEQDTAFLDSLLDKVYREGGYDFRGYKRGTITRRLDRRLNATGLRTYPEYMQFLDEHPEEYQKLADELTIKVGGFFRSPHSFQQVAGVVLPEIVSYKESQGEREIRFWSTACARGEEPYTIAIMFAEFLGERRQDFDILIHATDISRRTLIGAQAGMYSPEDVAGLSPAILQKYFVQRSQGYEVRADIRQMVRFSYFDLTSTAHLPVISLDGIFCCNVLIYWQKQLQERVLNMLYDALATPGYLVLGEAETPPNSIQKKLKCLDSKAKIYKKKGGDWAGSSE